MVIGIGGCSNSGKSKLAQELSDLYGERLSTQILCQDDFVKRRDFLTTIDGHVNWELPTTIKFDKYMAAVYAAIKTYELVICEGLFAFWFEELNSLYDKKIFLDIDKETFKHRKQSDLRWGKEPDEYIKHIWDSHLLYGKYTGSQENFLSLNASNEINLSNVIDFVGL